MFKKLSLLKDKLKNLLCVAFHLKNVYDIIIYHYCVVEVERLSMRSKRFSNNMSYMNLSLFFLVKLFYIIVFLWLKKLAVF